MSIPVGDTTQWDVLEWAQEQAQYLTSTQYLLLLYLCMNAFYQAENPECAPVCQVLSRRADHAEIRFRTSLSRSSVRRALNELQEKGYVIYSPRANSYTDARINVAWNEQFDDLRTHVRAGSKSLPVSFSRGSQ